jgi:hypothetical protein
MGGILRRRYFFVLYGIHQREGVCLACWLAYSATRKHDYVDGILLAFCHSISRPFDLERRASDLTG